MKDTFAEKLKEIRKKQSLTQKDVARALHVKPSTYTCYELGKSRPSLKNFVIMCQLFNIPYSALLDVVKTETIKGEQE